MKKKHAEKENSERWLLTYSDLITLLMILFVIMYASSNVDTNKYKAISQSFNSSLGGGKNVIEVGTSSLDTTDTKLPTTTSIQSINDILSNAAASQSPAAATTKDGTTADAEAAAAAALTAGTNHLSADQVEINKLQSVKTQLDAYLKTNGLNTVVNTQITEKGLEVSFPDTALFDSAKADIKSAAVPKIIQIGKIVNQLGNYIRVEGHTDDIPMKNNEFASNWQLSVIRATNVTELLIRDAYIIPEKISAVGYGQFRPKVSNSTESGRAQNRRVNIVVINNKFDGAEVSKPK